MIHLFGIKNCDKVRKAVKFLKSNGINFEFHDFRERPVDKKTIGQWIDREASLKQLFNTRGTTYRRLKLKEQKLDDSDKITWMAKENLLIKRPVLLLHDTVLIGFDEAIYTQYLLDKKG